MTTRTQTRLRYNTPAGVMDEDLLGRLKNKRKDLPGHLCGGQVKWMRHERGRGPQCGFPLSSGRDRMWFPCKLAAESSAYNTRGRLGMTIFAVPRAGPWQQRNPFEDHNGSFVVLVNDEEQRSLRPAFADFPAGRRVFYREVARAKRLHYVERNWSDRRPKSLSTRLVQAGR
jgi:uncharacterized protein YbdZ (MbtH family)